MLRFRAVSEDVDQFLLRQINRVSPSIRRLPLLEMQILRWVSRLPCTSIFIFDVPTSSAHALLLHRYTRSSAKHERMLGNRCGYSGTVEESLISLFGAIPSIEVDMERAIAAILAERVFPPVVMSMQGDDQDARTSGSSAATFRLQPQA
jgi:hypothetical protein